MMRTKSTVLLVVCGIGMIFTCYREMLSNDISKDCQESGGEGNSPKEVFHGSPEPQVKHPGSSSSIPPSPPMTVALEPTADHWQMIKKGSADDIYVFSAFFEPTQNSSRIRVIAAAKKKGQETNVHCLVTYSSSEGDRTDKVAAKVTRTFQWFLNYPYMAKMIQCPLRSNDIPQKVSIDVGISKSPNSLQVHYEPLQPSRTGKMCACVKPFFNINSFENVTRIIEFIEMYKLLGVSHFYLYGMSVTEWVRHILDQYIARGDVTFTPVDIPPTVVLEAQYQYALNTDCMLKAKPHYQYAALVDIDEFMFPQKLNSLIDLVTEQDGPKVGSICFHNCFVDLKLPDDQGKDNPYNKFNSSDLKYAAGYPVRLHTQLKTYRAKVVKYLGQRTKCIVKTETVEEMGVHQPMKYTNKELTYKRLPVTVGLMLHYRDKKKDAKWDWPTLPQAKRDTTAHKYGQKLIRNVMNIINEFHL